MKFNNVIYSENIDLLVVFVIIWMYFYMEKFLYYLGELQYLYMMMVYLLINNNM